MENLTKILNEKLYSIESDYKICFYYDLDIKEDIKDKKDENQEFFGLRDKIKFFTINDRAIALACENKKAYVFHFDQPKNFKEIPGNNEHLKTMTLS